MIAFDFWKPRLIEEKQGRKNLEKYYFLNDVFKNANIFSLNEESDIIHPLLLWLSFENVWGSCFLETLDCRLKSIKIRNYNDYICYKKRFLGLSGQVQNDKFYNYSVELAHGAFWIEKGFTVNFPDNKPQNNGDTSDLEIICEEKSEKVFYEINHKVGSSYFFLELEHLLGQMNKELKMKGSTCYFERSYNKDILHLIKDDNRGYKKVREEVELIAEQAVECFNKRLIKNRACEEKKPWSYDNVSVFVKDSKNNCSPRDSTVVDHSSAIYEYIVKEAESKIKKKEKAILMRPFILCLDFIVNLGMELNMTTFRFHRRCNLPFKSNEHLNKIDCVILALSHIAKPDVEIYKIYWNPDSKKKYHNTNLSMWFQKTRKSC